MKCGHSVDMLSIHPSVVDKRNIRILFVDMGRFWTPADNPYKVSTNKEIYTYAPVYQITRTDKEKKKKSLDLSLFPRFWRAGYAARLPTLLWANDTTGV